MPCKGRAAGGGRRGGLARSTECRCAWAAVQVYTLLGGSEQALSSWQSADRGVEGRPCEEGEKTSMQSLSRERRISESIGRGTARGSEEAEKSGVWGAVRPRRARQRTESAGGLERGQGRGGHHQGQSQGLQ